MTLNDWLVMAKADAEKRGLPDLISVLDGLAKATEQLRRADWNDDAALPVKDAGDHEDTHR